MRTEEQQLDDFLKKNNFRIIHKDVSDYFGDYYKLYSNDFFDLRFVADKSFTSIDIKSVLSLEDWYDLSLIKALIYDEKVFNQISEVEETISFLKNEMTSIKKLFDKSNYPITKEKLEDLGNKRAKQMFPDL